MSNKTIIYQFLCTFLLLLLLNGCAPKQWQDPLQEKEEESLRGLLLLEQEQLKSCPSCIDAEIAATWNSQLYDGGINGYLQIFLPSSIKLVALNPLGQPLFAITTDSKRFQTINAVKGVYKHGQLSSFVERHSLPEGILQGQWAPWLAGSMLFTDEQLTELRQDVSSRGIWLTIEKKKGAAVFKEYLLYDPQARRLLERVPISQGGDELAKITYKSWSMINGCPIPTSIIINGVSFGADFTIELTNILTDKVFTRKDFYLKLPPNYMQQYYP